MSLLCKLKKLVHKGELEEKDLERIVIIPKDATNGDVIKALFPKVAIEIHFRMLDDWWNSPYRKEKND